MAGSPPKIGSIIETIWSLLLLLCMGLVVAHIIWATKAQVGPESTLIEQTYTTSNDGLSLQSTRIRGHRPERSTGAK